MNPKAALRIVIPSGLVRRYRRLRREQLRERNRRLSAKEVFTQIYRDNEWHGETDEFFSGHGSRPAMAAPYCEAVAEFIATQGIRSVVDLGCGDFRVAAGLQRTRVRYVGVDIVDELVERNQVRYGSENISFLCRDIVTDELPDADLCLVRQVLQHLSNEQILAVLAKTGKYRLVLITEHYPAPGVHVVANRDKPHGSDTRTFDGSGVYLEQSPFNMKDLQLFLDLETTDWLVEKGESIRTFLVSNGQSPQ